MRVLQAVVNLKAKGINRNLLIINSKLLIRQIILPCKTPIYFYIFLDNIFFFRLDPIIILLFKINLFKSSHEIRFYVSG